MNDRVRLLPRETYLRDARLFVVAVEGEREEPWYFEGLVANGMVPARRVRLVILPAEDGSSNPKNVAARLRAYETGQRLIAADSRWLVVDVDRHDHLEETLQEANNVGWSFAVSNPCFEVWLQLHFLEEAMGQTSQDAKREWRSLRKDRKGWPFDEVCVERACTRAAARLRGDEWIPDSPGTSVCRLVRDVTRPRPTNAR